MDNINEKFSVTMAIDGCEGKTTSGREYILSQHSASFGWCIGESIAAALVSMNDCIPSSTEVFIDAAAGFIDGVREHMRNTDHLIQLADMLEGSAMHTDEVIKHDLKKARTQ